MNLTSKSPHSKRPPRGARASYVGHTNVYRLAPPLATSVVRAELYRRAWLAVRTAFDPGGPTVDVLLVRGHHVKAVKAVEAWLVGLGYDYDREELGNGYPVYWMNWSKREVAA